ncbi:MAG TPA: OmpA family protein [Bryobacteraceae bacterium]|nr:OmpA family protein [Bryobacteraceae bacterium]
MSRSGDVITVKDKKSGDLIHIHLFEDTKIERNAGRLLFARHPRMDMTAMVPGLTIDVEGVGNPDGHLNANKISFSPDDFAIAVAEEKQITSNQSATQRAQSTANDGLNTANAAQSSAKGAQSSADRAQSAAGQAQDAADRAGADAQAAGKLGIMDAAAVKMINSRVSDLDDYQTVAETSIYFNSDNTSLDDAGKNSLEQIAKIASSLDGYMIEIAGYASAHGSSQLNQKLSEERAAAVADYLRETGNVPFRRILAPAGYGASHHVPSDALPGDSALDRRVDIKLLVNKALSTIR